MLGIGICIVTALGVYVARIMRREEREQAEREKDRDKPPTPPAPG